MLYAVATVLNTHDPTSRVHARECHYDHCCFAVWWGIWLSAVACLHTLLMFGYANMFDRIVLQCSVLLWNAQAVKEQLIEQEDTYLFPIDSSIK